MNYKLTDKDGKAFLIGSIGCEIVDGLKNCRCGFSWKNEDEAIERQESNHCILMVGRPIDEAECKILQSAWVTICKDYYKEIFDMPEEIEFLDIQYNCFAEEIIGRTYDENGFIYGEINNNHYPFPFDVE